VGYAFRINSFFLDMSFMAVGRLVVLDLDGLRDH
jgi:hypothetical protein